MAKKAKRYALGEAVQPPQKKLDTGPVRIDPNSPSAIKNTAYWAAKKAKGLNRKRAKAATSGANGLQRRATRSPGGFSGGGTVESYSAQVQRKYGGGKV